MGIFTIVLADHWEGRGIHLFFYSTGGESFPEIFFGKDGRAVGCSVHSSSAHVALSGLKAGAAGVPCQFPVVFQVTVSSPPPPPSVSSSPYSFHLLVSAAW